MAPTVQLHAPVVAPRVAAGVGDPIAGGPPSEPVDVEPASDSSEELPVDPSTNTWSAGGARPRGVGPLPDDPHVGDASDFSTWVADHQLGLDLGGVVDEDEDANDRVVRNADAVILVHQTKGAPGDAAGLAVDPEDFTDPVLRPVLGGEAGRRQLDATRVGVDDPELRLLVTLQLERVSVQGDGPVPDCHLPEIGMPEHEHHGPVGNRSQPDWRVPPALFQGAPDEEPGVSTRGLDEGIGKAPAWFHVHMGHVDLDGVVAAGVQGCWGISTASRGSMSLSSCFFEMDQL